MKTDTVIFPWNQNFETGIAVIDAQHQTLVELLNQLAAHFAYGADMQGLNRVFDDLIDYTRYHFKTEEAIWCQYLAADEMLASHEKTHQDFVSEVLRFKGEQTDLPGDKTVEEIVSFLTHWLAFHILESDKHMAKIVSSLQMGVDLSVAKEKARMEMSGAVHVLIETVLAMYDSLSSRTLQLMREMAERQRSEDRLSLSRSVIDSTLEAIFITDEAGRIIDTNPSFCLDVQRSHELIVGMNIRQVKPGLFSREEMEEIWAITKECGHWAGETLGHDADGNIEVAWLALSAIRNKTGEITNYVGILSSVSQLMQRQRGLEEAAFHDALTGLPNRRLLQDRIRHAIVRSNRSGLWLALCYLDLDGFKYINDTFGHDAGDEVLRVISARLGHVLRAEDTVARLGGDEFVLLLGDLDYKEDAGLLLNRLLQDIAQPIHLGQTTVEVTASIGVSFYLQDQSTPEQLLKQADEAMYLAKDNGRSRYHMHD